MSVENKPGSVERRAVRKSKRKQRWGVAKAAYMQKELSYLTVNNMLDIELSASDALTLKGVARSF